MHNSRKLINSRRHSDQLWKKSSRQVGLTLLELIAVVGIFIILVAIVLAGLRGVRERALAATSQSNIRQSASLLILQFQSDGGSSTFFRSGSGAAGLQWASRLVSSGLADKASDIFFDPTLPINPEYVDNDLWPFYTFALNVIDTGSTITTESGNGSTITINPFKIDDPSNKFLLIESALASGRDVQIYRLMNYSVSSTGGVQMRHGNRAHVAFFDGRVEQADVERLGQIGFLSVWDDKFNVVNPSAN